jgi:hypothetical protein
VVELIACVRRVRQPAAASTGPEPAVVAAAGAETDLVNGRYEDPDLATGSSPLAQPRAAAADGLAVELPTLDVGEVRELVPAQHQAPRGSGLQFLMAAGWLLAAVVLVYLLGFTIGLPVFLFSYLVVARVGVLRAVILAIAVGLLVNIVFVRELAVTLPLSVFHTGFG